MKYEDIYKLLTDLNFKIVNKKYAKNIIHFTTNLNGNNIQRYIDVENNTLHNRLSESRYNSLKHLTEHLFSYYYHIISDETVIYILDNNPEYINYYKEFKYINEISPEMREKYAYLQNELF